MSCFLEMEPSTFMLSGGLGHILSHHVKEFGAMELKPGQHQP